MNPEDRTAKLEARVDRLEDQYREDVVNIHAKIDSLVTAVNNVLVRTAKAECPAPGSCISLTKELQHVIAAHDATMMRVERFELKLLDFERAAVAESRKVDAEFAKLEKQKAWILGAWSAIAFCSSIIGAVLTVVVSHFVGKL
jgi:hypothetical protein